MLETFFTISYIHTCTVYTAELYNESVPRNGLFPSSSTLHSFVCLAQVCVVHKMT